MKKTLALLLTIVLSLTLISCKKANYAKLDDLDVLLKLNNNTKYEYLVDYTLDTTIKQNLHINKIYFVLNEDKLLDYNNSKINYNQMTSFNYSEFYKLKESYRICYSEYYTVADYRNDTLKIIYDNKPRDNQPYDVIINNYEITKLNKKLEINPLVYNFRHLYNEIASSNIKVENLIDDGSTCSIKFNNKELNDIYNKYIYLYTNINYDNIDYVLLNINYEIINNIIYVNSFLLTINKKNTEAKYDNFANYITYSLKMKS